MRLVVILSLCWVVFSCNSQPPLNNTVLHSDTIVAERIDEPKFDPVASYHEDRSMIVANLQEKIENQEPLVVHCFVPLCDNIHQGIVPTSESLGDGFSLRTNLYWATSYGMKKFFEKDKAWKVLELNSFSPSDTILERVAFERTYENGAKVVLICDAYRGDMMYPCVDDFIRSLAGFKKDSINYLDGYLGVSQDADMMAFNGHNGLMDVSVDTVYANEIRLKDAVVIACDSRDYFNPYFVQSNSYPLVNTTSLLWPGAMSLDRVIEHWAMMEEDEVICNGAGDAYHEVKDCGQSAARRMFYTGW